jgi:ABC-2 type transport system ATP-binding protein
MTTAVEVQGLCKQFERRERGPGLTGLLKSWVSPKVSPVDAVKDLSFSMEEGESLAFIGPNGAGKSTTIKILTGIMHPTRGEARVLGLTPWRDRTRVALNIATVFGQRSQLWYHLPAGETFDLLARVYEVPEPEYRARRADLVKRFELEPLLGRAVRKLSLGERMRCEIAASLLHRPKVLFLDEPTIGLDVIAKQQIRELVRHLNQEEGVSVLLTSHDAGDIERLCKRVVVVNHGAIMFDDRVSTLRRRYLRRKVIDLHLREPDAAAALPAWPGVQVLKASQFGLKLEVDTEQQPIEQVMAKVIAVLPIADVTVMDPPMEEIIAQLYRERRETAPAPEAAK